MSRPKKLGLIAGNGKFPILFAQKAKSQNIEVIAAAVKGDTSFFLKFFVDRIRWFQVGELKKLFEFFHAEEIEQVLMAGQINPDNLFDQNVEMDEELKALFEALKDRKADTIFTAIADKLKSHGMQLMNSTFLLQDYLAPKGTLTRRGPNQEELTDIDFGIQIAKAMGGMDVGQTVVVKEKAIVAIEAMEGTDRTILRGGQIAQKGAVIIKTSKPDQDERFDVPVIGPRTLKTMIKARAGCLAIEAGKTIIIDREKCVRLANKSGICLIAT